MSHIETLIMNEVRKAMENLQRSGVGYIDFENTGAIVYKIDDTQIMIEVKNFVTEQEGEMPWED